MSYLVGSCDERFKHVSHDKWCIDFLPYTRGLDGRSIEEVIGYPNPNKGSGYGTWAEFYEDENEARARFKYLRSSGAVERADLLYGPRGKLINRWSDES